MNAVTRVWGKRQRIAVIGSGISGLAAAWLLADTNDVVIYESEQVAGGHARSIETEDGLVDMGFVVFNESTYPNLTSLFNYLGVSTRSTDMSFSVSLEGKSREYSGGSWSGLFAQRSNLFKLRHWTMLADVARFYRTAKDRLGEHQTIGELLDSGGYSRAFRDDHLFPMISAIWSMPDGKVDECPAATVISFFENHGLLDFFRRPQWKTVVGGSKTYVERILASKTLSLRTSSPIKHVRRTSSAAFVSTGLGESERFDQVVIATHADQALALLSDADCLETKVLSSFDYSVNRCVLHSDLVAMPQRKSTWSSWNFLEHVCSGQRSHAVTYWMNRLQGIRADREYLVTVNPIEAGLGGLVASLNFRHPVLGKKMITAQSGLWDLQGRRRTWFCGSYFGAGFHEDGIQSGLAVAEMIGGVRRAWQIEPRHDRIGFNDAAREIGEARAAESRHEGQVQCQ